MLKVFHTISEIELSLSPAITALSISMEYREILKAFA